jgi:RNA polymerase sigma-70 factor (ECF subfamily)
MDDAHLAGRARGDESAFARIVSRYGDRVFRVCLGILGERESAEDAAQDAFLKAYRKLESYDPAFPFSTWLFRTAANTAIDAVRKRTRERAVIASQAVAETRARRPEPSGDSRADNLRAHLRDLPDDYRTILTLRFAEEMSCAQIAATLGKTANAVSVAIYKAKKLLLERMRG